MYDTINMYRYVKVIQSMRSKSISRILAVVLCLMLIVSCIPFQAPAETIPETVSMTEGDVIKEFAAADVECVSSDPSVAWVDSDGSLNALKTGTATITVPNGDDTTEYTVTVSDYTDGSAVAGNLKILARFNDSMQFYDGHVYLIFTSYQDGVTINVPDLYAAYTIDDQYYKDINEDIGNGSNHTDKNTDKYFTFSDSTKSVTLNRGEVVTIGMYRDFDLSVPQAALGSIKNSSAWATLEKAGKAMVLASCEANDNISVIYDIEVYENAEDMVKFTFDDSSRETIYTYEDESGTAVIPYSGYLLEKGSEVTIIPVPEESKAVFWITANDTYVMPNEKLTVNTDTEVKVRYADAEMTGMPKEIKLKAMGDTYQLNAAAKYTGLLSFVAPYDQSITYVISDPAISVDENGLITVVGDIPEDGKVVYVTAYAGSSGNSVFARTKVTLGDYKGSRVVGKMTISSRRITTKEFMSHGCLTFTTYEDVDLNTSYYDYYRPDDRYNDLMVDYMKNPEKYTSDPAIYNDNDLGLEDRMSYFTTNPKGANSEPENISLVAGESITVSNYGFDPTNMIAIRRALEGSLYKDSKATQELVKQMNLYTEGSEEFDGAVAFDSLVETLKQMFAVSGSMGYNPADGQSEGGMTINREIYNQFRRNDTQLPNNYYEVEITADELELMKSYLANPENNFYSLFNKNCASGAVDLWNTTLADRPEYKLTANYSTIATEPMSLYFELGQMAKKDLDGKSGTDFVPHTVRYTDEIIDTIEKIKAIGEIELTDECKAKIDAAREAYDALTDGEKERVWNYDDLVNAENTYETLKKAKEDEELAKNIAAFEQYKSEQMTAARALLQEDDPIQCDIAVALAETLMLTTSYDSAKTLDENKAEIDSIMDTLKNDLDKIRHPEDPEPEVLIGDVNNDGVVDVMDSIMIQRFTTESVELTDDQKYAADVNNDGEVDIIDAMQIQKFTVEKLDEFEKKA